MKPILPIFVFSFLSLFSLETKAYAEQDTIIKYTNAVAPEYKVDFAISGDNPNTTFTPNASTTEQSSSSNTNAGGTITFPNGKKQEVAETPTSIEDKDGKIYAVGEDGKVTKAAEKTKETQSLAGNMSTREKEISEGEVRFSAYKGQSYAFDGYNPIYENVAEYKNKYEEFGGEQVAVKAIASGKPDRVSIAFDGGMPVDSIYFLTPAGVRYKAERDNGGYYLNLIGGEANDAQEVYAILPNRQDTTKPYTIGKLIVVAYPRQEKNLVLVPVNGAKVDTAGVLKKINEIYNPVNVYWKINIAENFNNTSWDTDKDEALNVTGSKWYTTYTEEMKALKTAYSQTNNIDQRTLYMFVMKKPKTDNETSSKTIVGDMPRGKQFGFLFTEGVSNKEQLAKTIAHELGHGYFQLKHPFEMGLNKEQLPYNLMDYAGGTTFNKYEWDLMHDPGIVTGLFESDTSGMAWWLLPWIDGVIDIGFVLYDAGVLIYEKATTGETSPENWIALSADGASILVPMSIGAGQVAKVAYKAATSAEKVNDVRKVVTKVDESTKAIKIYKHNYKYSDRVRVRGTQDPVSHNFPYSFDDVILSAKPIPKENGYRIFQQQRTMGGKQGVFEIGVTKEGIIDHRFFRPH